MTNIDSQFDGGDGGDGGVYHAGGEYVRGDVTSNRAESYSSELMGRLDSTHHRRLSDSQRMAPTHGPDRTPALVSAATGR